MLASPSLHRLCEGKVNERRTGDVRWQPRQAAVLGGGWPDQALLQVG